MKKNSVNWNKLGLVSLLIAAGPAGAADKTVHWDTNAYWRGGDQSYECYDRGGIYHEGICLEGSASAQVAAVINNDLRREGGNETSMGDMVTEVEGKISKTFDNRHFRQIFISMSAIPKNQVLDYNEKNEQNFHNSDRLRADGYVDRPWFLANIGANIAMTDSQDVTVLAGAFPVSGLNPLQGKPSRYYVTAPYGLMVRYDKGIQMNYQLKEELDRVLLASFSVVDGDTIKGESSLDPADSRANSYPAYGGTVELRVANALRKVFDKSAPYLKNHDLYIGVTGAHGDVGSFPGEKRAQDDMTTYLGYMFTSKYGEAEVRVFRADFTRNKQGDGNGRRPHAQHVNSKAHGVEVAMRGVEAGPCAWDFYYNQHVFNTDAAFADGEFTFEKVRGVRGWAAGTTCRNLLGLKNLDIGFEYGSTQLDRKGAKENLKYPNKASQFNLTLSYRFNLNKLVR